jgi:D-sedoheptulose 7-phosphate isomerase
MTDNTAVSNIIRRTARLLDEMASDAALCVATARAAALVVDSLRAGGKLLLCGNGGSAADAQHWAAELVGRFLYDRPGIAAIALTTDTSVLTAVGNDYGYQSTFSRQVQALGRPGDVIFALSTSGRSPNVLAAIQAAVQLDMRVIGFTGSSGGDMAGLCDVCLRIPAPDTARIQEGHEVLGHAICALIEEAMFPR